MPCRPGRTGGGQDAHQQEKSSLNHRASRSERSNVRQERQGGDTVEHAPRLRAEDDRADADHRHDHQDKQDIGNRADRKRQQQRTDGHRERQRKGVRPGK